MEHAEAAKTSSAGSPHGGDCKAVLADEERFFGQLRDRIQRSLARCEPLWLCDWETYMTPARARQVVAMYQSLAPAVCCLDAGDKLRALCPLLAAVPVEGHTELLSLIDRLKEAAECEHLDELGERLLRSRKGTSWTRQSWLSFKGQKSGMGTSARQGLADVMGSVLTRYAPSRIMSRMFASSQRVVPDDTYDSASSTDSGSFIGLAPLGCQNDTR